MDDNHNSVVLNETNSGCGRMWAYVCVCVCVWGGGGVESGYRGWGHELGFRCDITLLHYCTCTECHVLSRSYIVLVQLMQAFLFSI
jgi:hypothetical protein